MSTADFIPSSLAPAVAEHVRAHRARGRAAIAACGWWPDLLAAGTVVRQTKPLASRRGESEAQIAARNERESYHYVHGAMSPFVIERGYLASAVCITTLIYNVVCGITAGLYIFRIFTQGSHAAVSHTHLHARATLGVRGAASPAVDLHAVRVARRAEPAEDLQHVGHVHHAVQPQGIFLDQELDNT